VRPPLGSSTETPAPSIERVFRGLYYPLCLGTSAGVVLDEVRSAAGLGEPLWNFPRFRNVGDSIGLVQDRCAGPALITRM
jgi:hypothetical protein